MVFRGFQTQVEPGIYTYFALRTRIEQAGGWSVTDAWGNGSYMGFRDCEPAVRRWIQSLTAQELLLPVVSFFYR